MDSGCSSMAEFVNRTLSPLSYRKRVNCGFIGSSELARSLHGFRRRISFIRVSYSGLIGQRGLLNFQAPFYNFSDISLKEKIRESFPLLSIFSLTSEKNDFLFVINKKNASFLDDFV